MLACSISFKSSTDSRDYYKVQEISFGHLTNPPYFLGVFFEAEGENAMGIEVFFLIVITYEKIP